MKRYRVSISSKAKVKLESYVDYIAIEQSMPQTAQKWFDKAWTALQTLKTFPHRCQYAPENDSFDFAVRSLIVDSCLFLFTIDEQRRTVAVFDFRHGRQEPIKPE